MATFNDWYTSASTSTDYTWTGGQTTQNTEYYTWTWKTQEELLDGWDPKENTKRH